MGGRAVAPKATPVARPQHRRRALREKRTVRSREAARVHPCGELFGAPGRVCANFYGFETARLA